MSELLRKGLVGGSFLLLIVLVVKLTVAAVQTAPDKQPPIAEHLAKEIDVYIASQFNEMLQSYCQQFDVNAEYQGPLNPGAGRPGNHTFPYYDQYSTWIIVPIKKKKRTILNAHLRDDWFTIGLCRQDEADFAVHLMGEKLFLKLPSTYGNYKGQNTRLPIQLTVKEFMTGFSDYSRAYLTEEETINQIWKLTDEMATEDQRNH